MATTESYSSGINGKPTYSCIRCANRKVKCDRKLPCSACVRHDAHCVFNSSQTPRNRSKRLSIQTLTGRLRHYEALLEEKGIDPNKPKQSADSESSLRPSRTVAESRNPTSNQPEPNRSMNTAQVVQGPGHFKLVDNLLWTRMVEELHESQDVLRDSPDDKIDAETSDDDFTFVLSNQLASNSKPRHPPLGNIHQLWQIFIENIDPLTKVLHVPTVRPAIEKAASNIESVPRSFEALMFAIYSAAVMSMTDEECKQKLCESRKTLLLRYTSTTKAALSRAKFMETTSLVVLQALIIHLLAVRDIYEPRAVWSLTGVAVRIAQSMGLDRDGVHLGLSPFETEIRRRIWWQLKMHDFRTGELCGIAKFYDLHTSVESTRWPANINDDQLYPGMVSLATESSKLTDLVFVSLKCELLNYAANRAARLRQQGKASNPWDPPTPGSDTADIDESFKEIEVLLETKYLRYCDPSQPLHLMAMLMARCSINIIRFMSYHPRRWANREQIPESESQLVWEICTKLLEQHNMLQSNPQLKQFAWHAPYFQQWHAIIHVLDTLRTNPLKTDAEKIWKYIGSTYENNPDMIFDMRKPIHVAVGNLCLKAYGNREGALQNENTLQIPHFILQLRQQRNSTNTRRQERYAKDTQPEDLVSSTQLNPPNDNPRLRPTSNDCVNNSSNAIDSTHIKHSTTSLPPCFSLVETAVTPDIDPLSFNFGFDDGQVGNIDDVNTHPDFMLDQDFGIGDTATQFITWDQWDSWLADSNMIRPRSSWETFTTDI